jgi:NADH-quinone oxidoreductase subunit J
LGAYIFSDWVLPFEVLSVLLLAALVGAIVLSRSAESEMSGLRPATRDAAPRARKESAP